VQRVETLNFEYRSNVSFEYRSNVGTWLHYVSFVLFMASKRRIQFVGLQTFPAYSSSDL